MAVALEVNASVSGKTRPRSVTPIGDDVMSRKVMVMSNEDDGGYETTKDSALKASCPSSIVGVVNAREMGLQQSVFDAGMTSDCFSTSLYLDKTPRVETVRQ